MRVTYEDFIERMSSQGKNYFCVKDSFSTMHKKALFTCAKHGEFSKTPSLMLRTRGCPKCFNNNMNKHKGKLTHSELLRLVNYDKDTGEFTWKAHPRYKSLTGKKIGCIDKSKGYLEIRINNVKYLGHRLAFFYVTGELPNDQVDHIDQVRSNNAWSNLRLVTPSENRHNSAKFKGYSFDKRSNKYIARIHIDGKSIQLGYFTREEDAALARKEAEKKYW